MARTTGPLFSLDASGSVGGAITFSKWKGRNYVRRRIVPTNPKSGAQTGRRAMMRFLATAWNGLSAPDKATWQALADQLVASPFNAYVSFNMRYWHNFYTPMQASTGTRVGTPSDNAISAVVQEENRIKITVDGSALGDAWGIAIFSNLTETFDSAVGKCVLVDVDTTIAAHVIYWTPPDIAVGRWFDSICFADDGAQAGEGGELEYTPA